MKKSELLLKLMDFKKNNGEKYGIKSLGVFGSFSRDQATASSDVDICIQLMIPNPYIIVHIKEDLEQ
jgi:predicted nucleotidyltransferase